MDAHQDPGVSPRYVPERATPLRGQHLATLGSVVYNLLLPQKPLCSYSLRMRDVFVLGMVALVTDWNLCTSPSTNSLDLIHVLL